MGHGITFTQLYYCGTKNNYKQYVSKWVVPVLQENYIYKNRQLAIFHPWAIIVCSRALTKKRKKKKDVYLVVVRSLKIPKWSKRKQEKGNKEYMVQIENKWKDNRFKLSHINNYIKNGLILQLKEIVSLTKKIKLYIVYKKLALNIKIYHADIKCKRVVLFSH